MEGFTRYTPKVISKYKKQKLKDYFITVDSYGVLIRKDTMALLQTPPSSLSFLEKNSVWYLEIDQEGFKPNQYGFISSRTFGQLMLDSLKQTKKTTLQLIPTETKGRYLLKKMK